MFDPALLQQASAELFDPASYGARATPVAEAGGRGAAWFVDGHFGRGVLRHYRRGGWMASLSRSTYLWLGEDDVRSLHEYALSRHLLSAGLPVAAPIGAIYWRAGLGYRAAILVRRLEGVRPFAESVQSQGAAAPWTEVGSMLARFHRIGARHADLNAHNILIDEERRPWLIDWDKGRLAGDSGDWRSAVLARLSRSVRKHRGAVPEAVLEDGLRRLRRAHDQDLSS